MQYPLSDTPSSTTARILVAEDHPDSRDAMCTLLEAYGYAVLVAENGREAVDTAVAGYPDLILMDLMMPGLDGLEATRMLRERTDTRDTPIIAVTAMDGGRSLALEAGASDFLNKPIDVRDLLEKVRVWLNGA